MLHDVCLSAVTIALNLRASAWPVNVVCPAARSAHVKVEERQSHVVVVDGGSRQFGVDRMGGHRRRTARPDVTFSGRLYDSRKNIERSLRGGRDIEPARRQRDAICAARCHSP